MMGAKISYAGSPGPSYESVHFSAEKDVLDWCGDVKLRWQDMLFSEAGDHVLCRYFNFHLKGISAVPDTLSLPARALVIDLVDYLWEHYQKYLNPDMPSPVFFSSHYISLLSPLIESLVKKVKKHKIHADLRKAILDYLFSFKEKEDARYAYRELFYLKTLTTALNHLNTGEFKEANVNTILFQYNFNRLDYLLYKQDTIRAAQPSDLPERINFLGRYKGEINSMPVYEQFCYHPGWPGLAEMLDKWFKEELSLTNEVLHQSILVPAQAIVKNPLNLSVAHLACLIRVLREIKLLPEEGMASVFRFVAAHFKTKQQEQISDKSLSKEFYSINQVTAAVVRGKLLEMAEWLNRSYFPVLVAAGAACLFA
jgi:hypothetical protein